jgi:predicted transcriptional regulator
VDDRNLPVVARALSSPARLKIIKLLANGPCGVAEISNLLKMPLSSTSVNIHALAKAGLIETEGGSTKGKYNKLCKLLAREIWITLPDETDASAPKEQRLEIPIGSYTDCKAEPTCGIIAPDRAIGVQDVPASLWEPERHLAGLLYLTNGFVEYRVPNKLTGHHQLLAFSICLEMSSEYPFHKEHWPSDITLWVNGVEMGTWTAPGNPGGSPGKLTPAWWGMENSQYGLLKTWKITPEGTWIDGEFLSPTGLNEASITPGCPVTFRLGTKPDAHHNGGISIFGRTFGNYPQDIIVSFLYEEKR